MGGITDRRNKLFTLDKELLFFLYLRLGSYDHVCRRLQTEGIVNPETGSPFSRAGVRSSVLKSQGYADYFDRREADPGLPEEPTAEEYAKAADEIAKRLPVQVKVIAEAVQRKQQRLIDAQQYVANYGKSI